MNLSTVRGLVRPIVTFGLVGAFVAGAFFNVDAASILEAMAALVVGFWFGTRSSDREEG